MSPRSYFVDRKKEKCQITAACPFHSSCTVFDMASKSFDTPPKLNIVYLKKLICLKEKQTLCNRWN